MKIYYITLFVHLIKEYVCNYINGKSGVDVPVVLFESLLSRYTKSVVFIGYFIYNFITKFYTGFRKLYILFYIKDYLYVQS